MAVQLMLSHMSHQEFYPFNRVLLIPLAMCTYASVTNCISMEEQELFWSFQMVLATFFTTTFLAALISEIKAILGIRCFHIPSKHLMDGQGNKAA